MSNADFKTIIKTGTKRYWKVSDHKNINSAMKHTDKSNLQPSKEMIQ